MINRRRSLQMMASGFGAAMFPGISRAATVLGGGPKRVIFFLQNQGFDPATCIPTGVANGGSLAKAVLPEPMKALEPFKERMHIINGLHGIHTSPSHSAFFGALGGYRGSDGVAPSGSTIDYELSKVLPETLLPHLCIGMDSLENMRGKPTVANLSARGAGQPIFMHSNPNHLYEMLYGGISKGNIRSQHEARTGMLERVEQLAAAKGASLPGAGTRRYGEFVQGFSEMNGLRDRLAGVSDHLRNFAPEVDEGYTMPEFETDWHDRLLDLGISALKSGITNTLTIGSGRGEIFGSWKGLGVEQPTPFSPPSGPATGSFNGLHTKSKFLAAVIHSSSGDPKDDGSREGDWLWIQLLSRDADKSASFYSKLAGYELFKYQAPDRPPEIYLSTAKVARGSIRMMPGGGENIRPLWLPYVRVASLQKSITTCGKLGGKVLVAPRVDLIGGRAAILEDPTGAAIGILEWNQDEALKAPSKPPKQ